MSTSEQRDTADPSAPAASTTGQFESTPIRKKLTADTQVPAPTIIDHLSVVHRQLALGMNGRWLGPMPIDEFIQEFLPSPPDKPLPTVVHNKLQHAASEHSEASRYDSFIDAIKDWIPDLRAINTSQKGDQDLKPDICLYDSSEDVPLGADFDRIELWIEFKRGSQHVAFQDPGPKESSSSTIKSSAFIPETKAAQETRGQLLDYAGAHHSHQFRHFSFSMLVTDDHIRLFRWEPAGAIISSAFQYRENPEILAQILWRFNHLSARDRGHDISVRPVVLRPDVAKSIRESLDIPDTEQLLEYHLPGLMNRGHAYGPRPRSENRTIISRCTRTLPVVWIPGASPAIQGSRAEMCTQCGLVSDTFLQEPTKQHDSQSINDEWTERRIVYLKDTWRYHGSGTLVVPPEHEIYHKLIKDKTPNIPEFVSGGDVTGGLTRTHAFVDRPWPCVESSISIFQHYRLVLGTVGRALTTFKSTKELTTTVLDALKAHSHAYKVSGVLHRDVSPGNIIQTKNGRGILIDWEFAKEVNVVGNRRPDRTGTWQFMSIYLLQNVGKIHTLADDLESFLHVFGWTMLSFVPAVETYTPSKRCLDLEAFDESYREDDLDCGGEKKMLRLLKDQYPSWRGFRPEQVTPLFNLVQSLSKLFKSRYSSPPSDTDHGYLESSDQLIKIIEEALQNPENHWPTDDGAVKLPIQQDPVYATPRQELIRTSHHMVDLIDWEKSKGLPAQVKRSASLSSQSSPGPSTGTKRRRCASSSEDDN